MNYVANCRKDWHRQLSHQICDDPGIVFVEDLNLVALSRAMLGKHCLDAGFGQFFNIAVLKKVRYALCPMPYALCPMPSRTSSF